MNAAEQKALAIRLRAALHDAGIEVTRPDTRGGNVHAWEPVPPEALIGAWLMRRWRVTDGRAL